MRKSQGSNGDVEGRYSQRDFMTGGGFLRVGGMGEMRGLVKAGAVQPVARRSILIFMRGIPREDGHDRRDDGKIKLYEF